MPPVIEELIRTLRGQRVILDFDLAGLYEVPTKRFNQAFRRNRRRFPEDFAFQLTNEELVEVRNASLPSWSQTVTSSAQVAGFNYDAKGTKRNLSPFRGASYRPWAFTEHGALMAANILRSPRATELSVFVIRAFVKMRGELSANATILRRLAEIDKTLLLHDTALRDLYQKLLPLLTPPATPAKPKIGFHPGNR